MCKDTDMGVCLTWIKLLMMALVLFFEMLVNFELRVSGIHELRHYIFDVVSGLFFCVIFTVQSFYMSSMTVSWYMHFHLPASVSSLEKMEVT